MHMQDKQLLFQVVPGNTLDEDVRMLRKLAAVAGLVVGLQCKEGCTFISVRYNEQYTEYIRSRNAGRPRNGGNPGLTCEEVFSLKETEGAAMAASKLGMSVATFYRRCNENKEKKGNDPFV
jgi:hypothetical protein